MKYIITIIAAFIIFASCTCQELSGGNRNGHLRKHKQTDCPCRP